MMNGTLPALAVLFTAAGTLAAAPAADEAVESHSSAETANAQDEPDDEKKICRTEKVTGSLTRRSRICLTQSQWREIHDRTRNGVNDLQGSASGASRCIAGSMDVSCNTNLANGPL